MKTLKQIMTVVIVGLAGGILLYGFWEGLIGLGLTLAVVYALYKSSSQKLTTKGGILNG